MQLSLRGERGFTMITVMGAMLVIMILSVAAISAASGDIHLGRFDQDDKQAYAAAEAGINDYLFHLNQDSNYWSLCDNVPSPTAVNQPFTGTPPAPPTRKYRYVSGSTTSWYSIELIPKKGQSTCSTSDPVGSMIDNDGNISIRSTGFVGPLSKPTNKRAIVATFRRTGFLDFLYFTDLENQDPSYLPVLANFGSGPIGSNPTRATNTSGTPTGGPDLATWAADQCARHWWGAQVDGEGRAAKPTWTGQGWNGTAWEPNSGSTKSKTLDTDDVCGEITFVGGDVVSGPFHSNDDILVSGSPTFGRSGKNDAIEVSGDGYRPSSASPVFNPSLTTQARQLDLPPSNTTLEKVTNSNYLFTGQTTIVLNGANMTVTNASLNGGSPTSMALPSNGVIFAKSNGCSSGYDPSNSEARPAACGDIWVSGNYSKDLTIGAENDIVVNGNLTRASGNTTAILGLIGGGFVRVWHPISGTPSFSGTCSASNASNTPTNVKIDAAILAVQHSFTVDNYRCGSSLGNLTVTGVIAQKHRGVVGTSGGTGYIKDYNYDDKLKYRSPPYFLDPVQAAWRILREREQSPAR